MNLFAGVQKVNGELNNILGLQFGVILLLNEVVS